MSDITRDQYSRRASRALRDALAVVLARHVACIDFELEGEHFKFSRVFEDWPSYLDTYVPPQACVLPSSWKYGDWGFAPKLLDDTIEPIDNAGLMTGRGFGLYKTNEENIELELSFRAHTPAHRDAIILGIEDAFNDPAMLMSRSRGSRDGIILALPEYYGLTGRFSLVGGRVVDNEDQASREQRDAVITISAQASKVKVGPVVPLAMTITKTVLDPTAPFPT